VLSTVPRRIAALRVALWALRAALVARRRLGGGAMPPFDLPPVPRVAPTAGRGVSFALRPRLFSCLVRAVVRQSWLAQHGVPRDLVIGVTAPGDFQAHAWLEGDDTTEHRGYAELIRVPA
jgi:hypothetical protein